MNRPFPKRSFLLFLYCLLMWLAGCTYAVDSEDLLLPDEAFEFKAELKHQDMLVLSWAIADGYYLYRHKFKFVSLTPGLEVGEPYFPAGQTKKDDFFGTVQIYRNQIDARLPVLHHQTKIDNLVFAVTFQGCADAGICYMPILKTIRFNLNPL
jgi:thioredoxin:protein disulfide reductase